MFHQNSTETYIFYTFTEFLFNKMFTFYHIQLLIISFYYWKYNFRLHSSYTDETVTSK